MMAVNLEAVASYSSMRLVDSLAEGLAVGLFAAVLLRFSRRQNAATRFAIGFSALLAIAIGVARWPYPLTNESASALHVKNRRSTQCRARRCATSISLVFTGLTVRGWFCGARPFDHPGHEPVAL